MLPGIKTYKMNVSKTSLWNVIGVVGFTSLSFFSSCSGSRKIVGNTPANVDLQNIHFSVEEAPEWTALFKRTSGWFGGDGIFAIPQNEKDNVTVKSKTTILFSDTMIGEIENGKPKEGYKMIHNSVAILNGAEPQGKNIGFYWDKKPDGSPESLFIPNTPNTKEGEYYWLGDGFVNQELNNNTYIFGYRIRDIKEANSFGFEQVGTTLIVLPKGSQPPYKDQKQMDMPLFVPNADMSSPLSFGSGIFVNTKKADAKNPDGFVYVYGVRGKEKNLVAARVKPEDFEKIDKWRFWDGSNWVSDINKVANLTDHVSNELSVSELADGRYALFFQIDGISSKIGMRLSASPVGPFGPIIEVYDCKDDLKDTKDVFAYNAKAHPALSQPGELLVSYNVNSFNFFSDIKTYPNLYRPRFIRVKFSK
jgi:hypothetical protein